LALQGIVAQCLPGASIIDISEFGRTVIVSQSAKLFTKKVAGQVVDRGVAFPVCISVNDVVCNHAPLESSEEKVRYQLIWMFIYNRYLL
jgi:methionine aminopeptidase